MKILLTCHRDPFYNVGGSEEVVKQMASGLSFRHKVTVVTALQKNLKMHEFVGEVEVVRFLVRPGFINKDYMKFLQFGNWDVVLLYGQNVWPTNQAWRIVDMMHQRTIYFPVGFLNLKRSEVRPLHGRLYDWLYYNIVQRHLINNVDVTVALTHTEMEDIRKIAKPKKLVNIPNGVDYNFFQKRSSMINVRTMLDIPDKNHIILNLGGDYPNKRLALAKDSVAVLDNFQPSTFITCGPNTTGKDGNWIGLGIVSSEMKRALLQQADVLLVTSDFEGFGLVYLEALACGKPFVSTVVGVAPKLAELGGGRLVWPPEPVVIAKALSDELNYQRSVMELKGIAKLYDWSNIIQRLEVEFET
jgi:glycosyltransferase involved in cell wall biosynthesis